MARTKSLKSQVEDGIAELVSKGRATGCSFTGLRMLLTPTYNRRHLRRRRKRVIPAGIEHAGRWTIVQEIDAVEDSRSGRYS